MSVKIFLHAQVILDISLRMSMESRMKGGKNEKHNQKE